LSDGINCQFDPTSQNVMVTGKLINVYKLIRIDTRLEKLRDLWTSTPEIEEIVPDDSCFHSLGNMMVIRVKERKSENHQLFCISTDSGVVAHQISAKIVGLEYDYVTGNIFGIRQKKISSTEIILLLICINIINHGVTVVGQISKYQESFNGAIDVPGRRVTYSMLNSKTNNYDLVSINIDSGIINSSPQFCMNVNCVLDIIIMYHYC